MCRDSFHTYSLNKTRNAASHIVAAVGRTRLFGRLKFNLVVFICLSDQQRGNMESILVWVLSECLLVASSAIAWKYVVPGQHSRVEQTICNVFACYFRVKLTERNLDSGAKGSVGQEMACETNEALHSFVMGFMCGCGVECIRPRHVDFNCLVAFGPFSPSKNEMLENKSVHFPHHRGTGSIEFGQ